ncbi:MAG: ArsR family transcriptional regulator [Methanobacteriota archaeon]
MRKEASLVFDEKDEEMATLLSELGLPRSIARALVFLSQVESAVSTEIEHGADLRQPEVSVAMRELRNRSWVEKADLKREGKGRPVHSYRLLVALPEILHRLEEGKRTEADRNEELLKRLRELVAA